jgi:hypothetical protein
MTTINNYLMAKMTPTEKIEHTKALLEFWRAVGDKKCIRQYETQLQKYEEELGE